MSEDDRGRDSSPAAMPGDAVRYWERRRIPYSVVISLAE